MKTLDGGTGILGQVFRYRGQRYTGDEQRVVAAAVEAGWSDSRIARALGRTEASVKGHRLLREIPTQRRRGLWSAHG